MMPLVFDKVEIRKPRYDPHPEKSETENSEWRQGLFVVFKDYEGNVFDWMPKWEELERLGRLRMDVERINKELAQKHYERGC